MSGGEEDDDEFAFEGVGTVVGAEGGRGPQEGFFEFFGEFAGDEKVAGGAEFLLDFVEEFEDAVGGFVEDDGDGGVGEFAESSSAGRGLVVEEAFEVEGGGAGMAAEGDGGG